MLNRMFTLTSRLSLFLVSLGLVSLVGEPAAAALQKYSYRNINISQYQDESPKVVNTGPDPFPIGVVVIDNTQAPNPTLVKFAISNRNFGVTLILPSLSGFLYVRQLQENGPTPNQTGTGSAASSIDWGNLSGWTDSNASYCHSIPSAICILAGRVDLETVVAPNVSTNYDYGTWIFHGTGFTHPEGYIAGTGRSGLGNRRVEDRAARITDGTVSAIPLLGIAAVGTSIIAMGVASARRSRN